MTPVPEHLNAVWASLLIEELVRCGVETFVVSPGSRSTPLASAVARTARANAIVHFDERSAGFWAVGHARATGAPAALICTSGTAAAECFPAVIEAATAHLPLILLTADRPPELRDTGANQTINQTNLYGHYSRWFFDLPCPDPAIGPEMVLTTIDYAVHRSRHPLPGPVQLNCMFREPLTAAAPPEEPECLAHLSQWKTTGAPYTHYACSEPALSENTLAELTQIVEKTERGVLLVGDLTSREDQEAAVGIATTLGWPLLSDVLAGMPTGSMQPCAITAFDPILASDRFRNWGTPDTVLQLGGAFVSKRVSQWLKTASPPRYLRVTTDSERTDDQHQITHRYTGSLRHIRARLGQLENLKPSSRWLNGWLDAEHVARHKLADAFDDDHLVNEIAVVREVSRIGAEHALFVGNSMPIRDMNAFSVPAETYRVVAANRGASGIDGNVASAIGFACGNELRGTLVIGDLALLHDLNALALTTSMKQPLCIVVINNDGGGIFSFLPVRGETDNFESFWGTPHGLTFEPISAMFGLRYAAPGSIKAFRETYQHAAKDSASWLIEVKTDRQENHRLHEELDQTIAEAVDRSVPD